MNHDPIPLDWIPTIPRRYAATMIDALLMLTVFIVPIVILPESAVSRIFAVVAAFVMFFLYEPICTGRYVTLGQWMTGVRVRDFKTGQHIGIPRAWGRIILKAFLGFISFLIIPFTAGRRALHDTATGSIVILAKAESEFANWTQTPSDSNMLASSSSRY